MTAIVNLAAKFQIKYPKPAEIVILMAQINAKRCNIQILKIRKSIFYTKKLNRNYLKYRIRFLYTHIFGIILILTFYSLKHDYYNNFINFASIVDYFSNYYDVLYYISK